MILKNIIFKDPHLGYCRANIIISNDKILKIDILENGFQDYTEVEFYVTPGFVNTHLHPNQLLDRRLLDGRNISELLHGMHGGYKKTDRERYLQALLVLMEAVKSGSTTIYAVATQPYPVIEAFKHLKIKGAITCFYNDQWEGYGNPPALSCLHNIEKKFEQAVQQRNESLAIHVGSSSVESASNDLLILLDTLARKYKTKINIHVNEGIDSVNSCKISRQLSPIHLLAQLEILGPHWNLIHASTLEAKEIELIAQHEASVIHCPISNAKTGVGIAPIIELMSKGVKIGLGTDACSNNNTNNILNEAYFAFLLHAASHQNPKILSTETVLSWLTNQGHEIIGTNNRGVIAVNEPADLLLWSIQESPFVPLAYGKFDETLLFNAPDIKPHTVLIDGNLIVENYTFISFSEKEIKDEINRTSFNIQANINCTTSSRAIIATQSTS